MPGMSYDFPSELIELRRELDAAHKAWESAAASGDDDATNDAYRETHRLTLALHRDEWLRAAGNGHTVRVALREAAKNRSAPSG